MTATMLDRPVVRFSRDAVDLLARVVRRDGPQTVVLAWPCGATYLPAKYFVPGDDDVVVGRVGPSLVYADRKRLELHRDRSVVIDVVRTTPRYLRPPLCARSQAAT